MSTPSADSSVAWCTDFRPRRAGISGSAIAVGRRYHPPGADCFAVRTTERGFGERGMMNEVIRFALLGLGVGALYAFASQGLIVIYRGTGVLNFSLGATAIAGVFMQWELQQRARLAVLGVGGGRRRLVRRSSGRSPTG